ncbi:hypothetical protein Gpo141_00005362 [Globisporangium polare]
MSSLVANCWFVLLMHVVLCKKPSAQVKILMLIFDSRMDAVYAIAVPFAIFYPYYAQYNPKLQAIPASTHKVESGHNDEALSSRAETVVDMTKRKRTMWKKRMVTLALFLWGLFVLVLHFMASAIVWLGDDRGCLLEMRPLVQRTTRVQCME